MTGQLEQFQRDFAAALTAGDPKARPKSLDAVAGERFRIYRNNYFASLAKRLAEVFPATMTAIGRDAFHHIVYCYAAGNPPKARSLACFGGEFVTYLKRQIAIQPAFAIDLAALEFACHEALHEKDAKALDPKDLIALGEEITGARFKVHPAARLMVFTFPILEFKRQILEGKKARQTSKARTALLITRAGNSVLTTPLERPEELFLSQLIAGKTPAQAIKKIGQADQALDIEKAFSVFLTAGVFTP